MSIRQIFALCLFLAAAHVALASVKVVPIPESMQKPWITVQWNGVPVSGVRVEIERQVQPSGGYEKLQYHLATDAKGQIELPPLPNGLYRIVATYLLASLRPNLTATLYLRFSPRKITRTPAGGPLRSDETGKERYFSMELHPFPGPTREQLLAEGARLSVTQVATFQGTVCDYSGAYIPNASIEIIRMNLPGKKYAMELKANARGRFAANLSVGDYIVTFSSQGFRTGILHLKIAKTASDQPIQVKLRVGGVSQ
jgi:Carboxypeptidase regulatory-like domain